jgi:hypothetical protein
MHMDDPACPSSRLLIQTVNSGATVQHYYPLFFSFSLATGVCIHNPFLRQSIFCRRIDGMQKGECLENCTI